MLLVSLLQAALAVELFAFFLFYFPTVTIYEEIVSRVNPSRSLATTESPLLACKVPDGCGTCEDVTESGGTISSPNFPNDYSSGLDCLITIDAPSGYTISLSFSEFVVEKCCDFISVFDQTSDVLNVGLSGYDDPDTITSTTRKMTIKFTTNEDNSQITPASLGAGRWKFNYVFNME